jgi:putative salt-induced outer membrane protein YdiY
MPWISERFSPSDTAMTRHLTLVLALLAATAAATADELRLANGDRVTGRVVSLAGGTLTFETAHGTLQIPWDDVTALAIDQPILATAGDAAPASVTIAAAGEPGRVALQPGGETALADITALARPQPAIRIEGGASAGFVSSAGNTDVNSLRLDGDLVARTAADRYTTSASVTRSEDRDVETARNWSASLKYDRFVSSRLFFNANAIFTNDRFRDLDLRTALGAGMGYQVLDLALVKLTADAGVGWVKEALASQPNDSYTAARESAKLDVQLVPGRVELFHQHDGYFGVTGDDNLFVRMQNGVRIGLAAGFVTTLRLDLDYDKSPPVGRRNTDKTFALTLGYRF